MSDNDAMKMNGLTQHLMRSAEAGAMPVMLSREAGATAAMALPPPRVSPGARVTVRQAVQADLPFIDMLQKMHGHMVGWFPTKQLEKNIADGNVVVAEEHGDGGTGILPVHDSCTGRMPVPPGPLGYCIFRDQYMKRDDVGIVYQLNVLPLKQRGLIGASLVKGVFERSAYGCKLYCCWCAQDIQANWFWESIGFLPLAFRTGSRAKQRIHIFWQRRVREDDVSTPYWFPSQTQNGAVREDRLVIPIPPGTHWRDAKPVVLPGAHGQDARATGEEQPKLLPGGALVKPRPEQPKEPERKSRAQMAAVARCASRHLGGVATGKAAVVTRGGVKFIERADAPELVEPEAEKKKPKRPSKPRQKNDATFVKAARELRDRFLEQVNVALQLPPGASGKYDVSRMLMSGDGQGDEGGAREGVRLAGGSERRLLLEEGDARAA